MTEIEKRFYEAAIAHFARSRKSEFIEVTTLDNDREPMKLTIAKSSIVTVRKWITQGYNAEILTTNAEIHAIETYDQIKEML